MPKEGKSLFYYFTRAASMNRRGHKKQFPIVSKAIYITSYADGCRTFASICVNYQQYFEQAHGKPDRRLVQKCAAHRGGGGPPPACKIRNRRARGGGGPPPG